MPTPLQALLSTQNMGAQNQVSQPVNVPATPNPQAGIGQALSGLGNIQPPQQGGGMPQAQGQPQANPLMQMLQQAQQQQASLWNPHVVKGVPKDIFHSLEPEQQNAVVNADDQTMLKVVDSLRNFEPYMKAAAKNNKPQMKAIWQKYLDFYKVNPAEPSLEQNYQSNAGGGA